MFQLNKQHREALLNQLEAAKEELWLTRSLKLDRKNKKDDSLIGWSEIDEFLLEAKIKLINESLVNNEIDC